MHAYCIEFPSRKLTLAKHFDIPSVFIMLPISSPFTQSQIAIVSFFYPTLGRLKALSISFFTLGSFYLKGFLWELKVVESLWEVHSFRHSIGVQKIFSEFSEKKWRLVTLSELFYHYYWKIKETRTSNFRLFLGTKISNMSITFNISCFCARINYIAQSHWRRKLIINV